jgi:hypothetical protein
MAWDVDEVQLHWSLSVRDIFRKVFRGGRDAPYQNTPDKLFNYSSFQTSPDVNLRGFEGFWYDRVQRLIPSLMRQTIQFHPGGRAFLLGMRSAVFHPLTLITTGPTGRLLILLNEDPALKQIFFGKLPAETVTIEEIRRARNIYTREDLVNAMRIVAEGREEHLRDPLIQDYIRKIKTHPKMGHKLKHPAIARILKKQSFDVLVDDSPATYRMLGDLSGFTVLQPASARPSITLNFTLGSRRRYLDRMVNSTFSELARYLKSSPGYHSRKISGGPIPKDYPVQRFAIEIPWARFRQEFALPKAELDALSKKIANLVLPKPVENPYPDSVYGIGDGGFHLLKPGQRVAILGDIDMARTYNLAKTGHFPVVIDWDAQILSRDQRIFNRRNNGDIRQGEIDREVYARWVLGDWYKTIAQADAVEAFYPLSIRDLPVKNTKAFIRDFMERALHSKLRPEGGSVYLATEVEFLVREMKEIIREDPSLELMDMDVHDKHWPPIIGGHGVLWQPGILSAWILYQKNPPKSP